MELKDFIKETISNITLAVNELNKEYSSDGLLVNPKTEILSYENKPRISDGREIQKIDFSLSVSVSDKTEGGGGLQIQIFKVGLNQTNKNDSINSIKFSIPVVYPGIEVVKRNYSK